MDRRRLRAAWGALLLGLVWVGAAAAQAPSDDADALLDRYRKLIVLLDGEEAFAADRRDELRLVGRLIFHEQLQLRDRLVQPLSGELAALPQAAPRLERFLDRLERDPDWHDADKLAFRETVDELIATLPDGAAGAGLRTRLHAQRDALQRIHARYEQELKKVYDALGTRAAPARREAWQDYVAFLRGRYQRAAIVAEYASDTDTAATGATRSSGESALETFGRTLPDKTLLLTFDDGPHPRYTDRVLQILQRYGLTGVFFQVGQNIGSVAEDGSVRRGRGAQVSERILAQGSVLANHSYSHALLPKLGEADLAREIDATETLLHDLSPQSPPLFRPPYGARNAQVLSNLQMRRLRSVQWNIDSQDWADPIASSVAERVLAEVERQGRGIVLFHDIHARAVDALPTIIETLQAKGYRFASWNGSDFGVSRAVDAAAAATAASGAAPYRESWAVVIGIDAYEEWPRLRYAVRDAEGVRDLLVERYGFERDHVFTLLDADATRENIVSLLGDKLADPALVHRDDRVFVFYAGHGATRPLASGRDLGYIIPVDADLTNYQARAISMTHFQDIAEAIPAKHLLFVMDSCYSGLGLTRAGALPNGRNYLQEIARRSARQMFTAGGADQQVADSGPNGHSIFTWTLLRALGGEGDLNGDRVITATELAAWSSPLVSSLSHQTPAFGSLPGSEGGEFFFELGAGDAPLNALSEQLDADAGDLNAELEQLRRQIADKAQRNSALARQLAEARSTLRTLETAPEPSRSVGAAEQAIRDNERGTAHYQRREYAEALAAYLAAARGDPRYALAANNVGFVYYKLGQYAEAIDWFERTLRIDPQRAVAWLNAADAYVRLGRDADAGRAYARYLELHPASASAEHARAQLARLRAGAAPP